MNKNIVFTKTRCNVILILYIGILLICIFTVIGLSVRLFKLDYSNLSYGQIVAASFCWTALFIPVFAIITVVGDCLPLIFLKQVKLALRDHYIVIEKGSESLKIAYDESSYIFFYFGGWILIWPSEDNFVGIYITKDLIGPGNLKDWNACLRQSFKSYTMPKNSQKEILRKFHINVFNLHKYTRWPPRVLCKQVI